ncbi:MAG: hypothetical protein R6V61_11265 [Wenzhouxiangellaceae bacterium]
MGARSRGSLRQFLRELKRRRVYSVAVGYAAGAFVVIQVADLVFPALGIPPWAYRVVVILSLIGFPIALALAWAYEVTAEGTVVPEDPGEPGATGSVGNASRRFPGWGVALLVGISVAVSGTAGYMLLSRLDPTPVQPSSHSIAVLPFKPIGQSGVSPFMDGVHDDLLTRLSVIREFMVIARTTVDRYRDSDKSTLQIARELDVDWVLEGGIQQVDERVKVNVRLVEPETGAQAWSESYQQELSAENLFGIQADITRSIAHALEARLSPQESDKAESQPTDNLAAYRLLIEARTLLTQRGEAGMRRALDLFRRAVEIDPEFARAWLGIADSIYELIAYGFGMPGAAMEEAETAVRRAIELAPELPEAHVTQGLLSLLRYKGQDAIRYIEQAKRMQPNNADANSKISWVGQILDRPQLAFEGARRAIDLDPLALEPRVNLALGHLIRREPERALAVIREKRHLLPEWSTLNFYEGVILYHLGRHDEAVDVLEGLSISWAGAGPLATAAVANAAAGRELAAREVLEALKRRDAHPFLVGLVHLALNEDESAFAAFERARDWRIGTDWSILAARYLFPEVLGPVRADPRFGDLLGRIDRAWGLVD